jgi:hypothetical protein
LKRPAVVGSSPLSYTDPWRTFRDAWIRSGEPREANSPIADELDRELHTARIDRRKGKMTYDASLNSLPDGCFVQIEGSNYLVLGETLLLWSPDGYLKKVHPPDALTVTVLTPEPIVRPGNSTT